MPRLYVQINTADRQTKLVLGSLNELAQPQ
jgi:hypothetical protein